VSPISSAARSPPASRGQRDHPRSPTLSQKKKKKKTFLSALGHFGHLLQGNERGGGGGMWRRTCSFTPSFLTWHGSLGTLPASRIVCMDGSAPRKRQRVESSCDLCSKSCVAREVRFSEENVWGLIFPLPSPLSPLPSPHRQQNSGTQAPCLASSPTSPPPRCTPPPRWGACTSRVQFTHSLK
jgi:hypothetical protein